MVFSEIWRTITLAATLALTASNADAAQLRGMGDIAFPDKAGADSAGGGSAAAPAPDAAGTMVNVSFSEAQSKDGEKSYNKYCLECHGKNLNDGEFGGPPLRGLRFQETFGDAPVSALYYFIQGSMPPDKVGQLHDKELIDIIAYILDRNGYKTGAALPEDVDALDKLIVAK